MKFSQLKTRMKEAATLKAMAQRMMRDMTEMLSDKNLPEGLRKQIEDVRKELKRTWAELAKDSDGPVARASAASEASSKNPDDYLVADDPEKVSTFHLQVKTDGKPDHRLMGAAWAALHGGYRGQKYEGPDKGKALAKLKALYKSEDMALPGESAAEAMTMPMPTGEATSEASMLACLIMCHHCAEVCHRCARACETAPDYGDELAACARACHACADACQACIDAAMQFGMQSAECMATCAVCAEACDACSDACLAAAGASYYCKDICIECANACSQCEDLCEAAMVSTGTPIEGGAQESNSGPAPEGEPLAESIGGAVSLIEADPPVNGSSARDPLNLDVRLITPGWGNSRDNHYYSAEVLKRDARVFQGVKMYATDHVAAEKSVRTEVAQIESITGFDDAGAPIARVKVFDPAFAEQTRNRAKAGILDSLECSILAYGKAKPGEVGGRKGNIVEAITAAQSVDWVTKAGAGGQALRLAESGAGQLPGAPTNTGVAMDKQKILEALGKSALPEPARKRLAEREFKDEAELNAAIQAEVTYLAEAAPPPTAPDHLAEADVKAALGKSTLPAASQKRLAEREFKDQAALDAAITAEVAYLKEVTGSGRPVSSASTASAPATVTLEEQNKRVDQALDKFFGPSRRAPAPTKGA